MTAAITGLGAICGCGRGVEALWDALRDGRSGLAPIRRAETGFSPDAIVGQVPDDDLPPGVDRVVGLALVAAAEAWGGRAPTTPERVAVVIGTSAGPLSTEPLTEAEERADPSGCSLRKRAARHDAIAAAVADHLGLRGPRLTVSAACSSGNAALTVARDLLWSGDADVVLVGGVDGLSERRYAGFDALGALAPGPCAPFSWPVGLNLGEGAAFLVLERPGDAAERALATLLGAGSSGEAAHATAPEPSGGGMARSILAALRDARALPEEVGWYAAHGTGTDLNDAAEWRAVVAVFPPGVPLSAPKSFFGHPFGATGPLQALAAVLAVREGLLPPTLRFAGPRRDGPADPVADARARPAPVSVVVSHNAGFGGANHTVVVGRAGRATHRPGQRPVFVQGTAVIRDRAAPAPRWLDTRRMDPSSAWWTLAAATALGEGPLRGVAAERCGQVAGTAFRPVTASGAFRESFETRGPRGVSAQAFSRLVMNAPLGDASRALGLRGPVELLANGLGAGLVAVARGVDWLATRPDLERLVVGGFDERDPHRAPLGPFAPGITGFGEGAAAATLSAAPSAVRVSARALAGTLPQAVARIRSAGPPDAVFPAFDEAVSEVPGRPSPGVTLGHADAMLGAAAFVAAAESVRSGEVRRAWVLASDPGSAAVAVVVEAA